VKFHAVLRPLELELAVRKLFSFSPRKKAVPRRSVSVSPEHSLEQFI